MSKKSLNQWDNLALFQALITILNQRFGTVPKTGILAGQSVASACYEVLGVGVGPFKDLDVFIVNMSGYDKRDGAEIIFEKNAECSKNYRAVCRHDNQLPAPSIHSCSFSDEIAIEPLEKSGYRLLFSYQSQQNTAWNIVEIEPLYYRFLQGDECKLDFGALDVINGFDINACCIAIDLDSKTVVWTPCFEEFLSSKALEVTTLFTPSHTAFRLLRKQRELPFASLNIHQQMELLQQARAVASACQPPLKGYMPGHLMSEWTLEKNREFIAVVAPYFNLGKVQLDIPCDLDSLDCKGVYIANRFRTNEELVSYLRSKHDDNWLDILAYFFNATPEMKMAHAINAINQPKTSDAPLLWELRRKINFYSLNAKDVGADQVWEIDSAIDLACNEVVSTPYGVELYSRSIKHLMRIVRSRGVVDEHLRAQADALKLKMTQMREDILCKQAQENQSRSEELLSNRIIHHLLGLHPETVMQYQERKHQMITELYKNYPTVHNYVMDERGFIDSVYAFDKLAMTAQNIQWLVENQYESIASLYANEPRTINAYQFPSIYAMQFRQDVVVAIERYFDACRAEFFEDPKALVDVLIEREPASKKERILGVEVFSNKLAWLQARERFHNLPFYYNFNELRELNYVAAEITSTSHRKTLYVFWVGLRYSSDECHSLDNMNDVSRVVLQMGVVSQHRSKNRDGYEPDPENIDLFNSAVQLVRPHAYLFGDADDTSMDIAINELPDNIQRLFQCKIEAFLREREVAISRGETMTFFDELPF